MGFEGRAISSLSPSPPTRSHPEAKGSVVAGSAFVRFQDTHPKIFDLSGDKGEIVSFFQYFSSFHLRHFCVKRRGKCFPFFSETFLGFDRIFIKIRRRYYPFSVISHSI